MISRRPRVLLAVALLCIITFLTFRHHDALADFGPDYFSFGSSSASATMVLPATGKLHPEPHKLPNPDAFRSHFAAAISQKGLTMAEARSTCNWPKDTYVNFQFPADKEWVVNPRSDEEVAQRRKEWQDYVRSGMIPWDRVKHLFKGRGIVVLAGNHDTVMRLGVILRRLVQLNSTIPVEVHYWDDEMNDESKANLSSYYPYVTFNDLSKPHNILQPQKNHFLINFQLKTAALINTRFAEPLLLDSDNVPVLDPSILYESNVYKEYGTVFWPDIARTWPQNPAWAIFNVHCRMDEYEQESGQMLVDKRRFWYHLQLSAWFNNVHGDYYDQILLGDKDLFRYAWHALKTPYGKPRKWLTSVGVENDGFYCGHSFAQHHPDDHRVAFVHGGLTKIAAPEVVIWNREQRGGYYRHYKRATTDEDPSVSVHVQIIFDPADYKPNHTELFNVAMCTQMKEIPVRPLDEILPNWEKTMEELDMFWYLRRFEEKLKAKQEEKAKEAKEKAEQEKNDDKKE
jgi:alpha 1,2-mannosyltransferase